ncbi:MAG: uracil-DNA glycosylase [Verrucomicrobiota bacterium]
MPSEHPVSAALGALASFLEREKRAGRTHVRISEESERSLSELPLQFLRAERGTALTTPTVAAPEARKEPVAASVVPPKAEKRAKLASGERGEEWARKELNQIFRDVKASEVSLSLGTLRDTVVFATGNPLADLMFVGEAPGAEEEKQRKPFVGPAGQKLNQILSAMGLDREEVYISNIVKYRPKKGDGRFQGSSNRKPDATEMESCMPFIRREIEVVAPKVIVALGATAAEGLLERGGAISSLRQQTHEFAGVPVVVTYHPSFLLRQESEPDQEKAKFAKRKVWEDMLKVMDLLGLSISEKQRGFFT